MTSSEWKDAVVDLLDGVERELGPSVPIATKVRLNEFRRQLNEPRVVGRRKRFVQVLDAFLLSEPYWEVATKRYWRKQMLPIVKEALTALEQAQLVHAQCKTNRRDKRRTVSQH
jgi:hypothetical protein